MSESPTEGASTEVAPVTGPTTEVAEQPAADVQNQEVAPQAASESTEAKTEQTQTEGESAKTAEEKPKEKAEVDDIANFARAQGFDPDNLTEGERKALTIARDNQKALRSSTNKSKLSEATAQVDGTITKEEMDAFQQEFRQYQSVKKAEAFFAEEGRDDSLAPVMSEILEEKKAAYGAEYARVLSSDLPLLYDLARVRQGSSVGQSVDPEAIRREERESMNKQLSGASANAHASANTLSDNKPQVTTEWLRTKYEPGNPEHDKLVAAFMASATE